MSFLDRGSDGVSARVGTIDGATAAQAEPIRRNGKASSGAARYGRDSGYGWQQARSTNGRSSSTVRSRTANKINLVETATEWIGYMSGAVQSALRYHTNIYRLLCTLHIFNNKYFSFAELDG